MSIVLNNIVVSCGRGLRSLPVQRIPRLKELIKLLPITPIDAEELKQIYGHAKQVMMAA